LEKEKKLMAETKVQKQDVVVTRVLDAPVERAWQAWTDPELVKRWWGPDGFTAPVAKIDFRDGGTSLVCMRAPRQLGGQDMYSTWAYAKIVPMERIEFIHNLADQNGNKIDPLKLGLPADFPQDVRHVVTFKAQGAKTEIAVTEIGWTPGQMRNLAELGLGQCLDKMAAIFA
jgi:uncharacterized protein YndB with AHSA1/START domain